MEWKMIIISFLALTTMSFSNSEEINREERRRHEEEIRKLEKAEAKDEIQLNELEENIEAIGDEIKSLEISGNTILKASEIEVLKKKYIGKIGGKNILNLMRELENLYLVKGY
ncbi:POTRA domain-containing protein, partial [Fusobacterium varium]|nr:ShlB/FhaC/HecB family hemolysin secretion/activation protein [Fusobacterium varium]